MPMNHVSVCLNAHLSCLSSFSPFCLCDHRISFQRELETIISSLLKLTLFHLCGNIPNQPDQENEAARKIKLLRAESELAGVGWEY